MPENETRPGPISALSFFGERVMEEIEEAEVVTACSSGAVISGPAGVRKRTVKAAVLRRCCHRLRERIDPRGLRLRNVTVVGQLDLSGLSVPFPLHFEGCEFDSVLVADGAELPGLSLTGCLHLPGLAGNGLRLRRNLNVSRSRIAGAHRTSAVGAPAAVWLCEAEIGGDLLCAGTAVDGLPGRAIQADRLRVGGDVQMAGQFSSSGEVRLAGASIAGSLDLSGAHLRSPDGPALSIEGASIGGSVLITGRPAGRRPQISGCLDMAGARIASQLLIRDAVLQARGDAPEGSTYAGPAGAGTAIHAARLTADAGVTMADGCQVKGSVNMSLGNLGGVSVGRHCTLSAPGRTALDLTGTEVRALLRLDEAAAVEGTIRLAGAAVRGTLALHGQLSRPEHRALVAGSSLTVEGDVILDGLRTLGGAVNFRSATLGSLAAANACLHNPGGYTLSLHQAKVNGTVVLNDGFASTGLLFLNRSVIEGRLRLTGGSFTCPAPVPLNEAGHAIAAISATVRSGIDLGWLTASPSVDFTDAAITFLADDPAAWPPRFTVSGLTYDRFDHPQGTPPSPLWDHAARCAWLSRQASFDPGPYEQAAKVYRQHGYATQAEEILIAQRNHARKAARPRTSRPRRVLAAAYALIGYGYRPTRVLWFLAVLLALVTASLELPQAQATLRATNGNGAVYTTRGPLTAPAPAARAAASAPDPCGSGEVRCFSPALYAIDTVIPLISLDQRSTWYPDPHIPDGQLMLWWLNLATLLGWLMSSIFALSLARLSRNP
jgi:hypothetical protein